jgi:septal ring factor EnvC (AmiA/AmiB activator)
MTHINKQHLSDHIKPLKKLTYMSLLLMALNLQTWCSSEPIDFNRAKIEQVNKIDDNIRKNNDKIKKLQEEMKKLQEENRELEKTKNTRNK